MAQRRPWKTTAARWSRGVGRGGASAQRSVAGSYTSWALLTVSLLPPTARSLPSSATSASAPRGVRSGARVDQEFRASSYS